MEELQARHRKEQRDLQSQVTQKKKQASKKTRKAVNEECERLEMELRERQAREIAELNGDGQQEEEIPSEKLEELTLQVDGDDAQNGYPTPPAAATEEDQPSVPGGGKKRNRQKDRLARRAAEQEALAAQAEKEASHLPDLKKAERERMLESMKTHSLIEKEIRADGHCLYSAVADQLEQLGIPITPSDTPVIPFRAIRGRAADYISSHQDDFVPFLEEPLPEYLHKVRNTGEWGGQLELMALAKTYETDINVLQDHGRIEKIESGNESEEKKTMWLGYYKHGFGLGEHYNSLRRKVP